MSAPRVTAPHLLAMLGPASPGTASYLWLSDAIRLLVGDGRLLHGTRLPSERDLVAATGLSRTTVSRAYARLRERGYATARHGSGTHVVVPGGPVDGAQEPVLLGDLGELPADVVDLRSAAPSGGAGLAAAYERAVARVGAYTGGLGLFALGVPELREAVADRYTERGAPTDPSQVIVTNGSLAATAAVVRALLRPSERVVLDTPGYPGTLACLRHERARLVPVPASSGTVDLTAVAERLAAVPARAMFVVPDFHNPTGTLMTDDDRARLAALWRRHQVVGVVDETLCELWLDRNPDVLPMAAHAPGAVTVGGVSKSHWGGLRIGWIRAPRSLTGAIARARATLDLGAPVLEQLVVTDLLRERPGLDDGRRAALREQRDRLLSRVGAELPGWRTVTPAGGLSLWWRLPVARSSALATAAERHRLMLAPGSAFAAEGRGLERWVRTPYGLDRASLDLAVDRLGAAWRSLER